MAGIKNVKPSGKHKSGTIHDVRIFKKYIGTGPIIYRSSWEYRFIIYCENNNDVIRWSSEPVKVPYIDMNDKKNRNYYPDFYMKLSNGKEYLVEVKPKVFCKKPNAPKINNKKKIESYKKSMKTYRQNLSKWKFAKIWAINRGWLFTIVTEDFFKTTSYK
jgi:hypothetical protein